MDFMKILVTGPTVLSEGQGGQVTHLKTLISIYESHDEIKLHPFFTSSARGDEESMLVKLVFLCFRFLSFPFCVFKADLVHMNSSLDNKAGVRDLLLIFWVLFFQKPYVLQFHGGVISDFSLLKRRCFRYFWSKAVVKARCCLVLKHEHKAYLERNGVKRTVLAKNYVSSMQESPQWNGVFSFVFLGRLVKEKGVYELLDAVKELSNEHRFILHLCGDGPELDNVKSKISRMSLNDYVVVHGAVHGVGKSNVLTKSNCFILPSYAEALPYSLLESMAQGLAPAVSNVGLVSSVVKPNINGLLFEARSVGQLRDAMKFMLVHPDKCSEMGKLAKTLIDSEYSLENMQDFYSGLWWRNG